MGFSIYTKLAIKNSATPLKEIEKDLKNLYEKEQHLGAINNLLDFLEIKDHYEECAIFYNVEIKDKILFLDTKIRYNWLCIGTIKENLQRKYGNMDIEWLCDESEMDYDGTEFTSDKTGKIFPHFHIVKSTENPEQEYVSCAHIDETLNYLKSIGCNINNLDDYFKNEKEYLPHFRIQVREYPGIEIDLPSYDYFKQLEN